MGLLDYDLSEIIKKTKYNGLSLLQRIFFDLKQHYILSPICDDNLEHVEKWKLLYLLKNHVFPNIDKSSDSFKYRNEIMKFFNKQKKYQ